MGSPNFYTKTDGLNVAIDMSFFPDFDSEDAGAAEDAYDDIREKSQVMREFIESLPNQYWHRVVYQTGHYEGFQVYIEENWNNRDDFEIKTVKDWENYQHFTDASGQNMEICDCPYFKSNAVNITYFSLSNAIDKEYKTLHAAILAKAIELELGEVVGSTWTSSVEYPLNVRNS